MFGGSPSEAAGAGGKRAKSGLVKEIRRATTVALVTGILSAVICLGGVVFGSGAGETKGRAASMRRMHAAQEDRLWDQALVICVFLVGIGFACYAIKCGRRALRLIKEDHADSELEGRATAGMTVGWVALGVNALFLLITGF